MKTKSIIRNIIVFFAMLFSGRIDRKRMNLFVMMALSQSELTHRSRVVMKFPGDHPNNIIKAQGMHDAIKISSWMSGITDIVTILAAYQVEIDKYKSYESKAQQGLPGAVAARDSFSAAFISETSEDLRLLVQGVVNQNKANALEIAKSCDMDIQGLGGRPALEWSVEKGETSGSVELAGSIREYDTERYALQWQRTTTPNEESSWYLMENEIVPTLQASTTVTGLKLKETMYFRHRVILKEGPTNWSEVLSIIIT